MKTKPTLRGLLILLFEALLAAVILYGVRRAFLDTDLTAEEKMGLLSGVALGVLVTGVGVLRLAMREGRLQFSPVFIFLLAYAVPALIFLSPFLVKAIAAYPGILMPDAEELARARAGLFIWQSCTLAGWQALRLLWPPGERRPPMRMVWGEWFPGILFGVALWLVLVFSSSLLSAHLLPGSPLYSKANLPSFLVPVALLLSPFGVQATYRLQVEDAFHPSPRKHMAVLGSAALFALLQFQPLLFIPAFLASLGFSWLAQNQRSLLPVVLAHTTVNLFMLLFNWQMVL